MGHVSYKFLFLESIMFGSHKTRKSLGELKSCIKAGTACCGCELQ